MTLEMIETFLVLAKTQSFSRTAEQMFVAQSTITNRVKLLELELGCVLFNRSAKSVSITNAGKRFKQYAQQIYDLSQESVDTLRNYQHFQTSITVSATDAIWRYFLMPMLMDYVADHPTTAFEFLTKNTQDTIQQVVSGEADIGAVLSSVFHPEMEQVLFFKEMYCLAGRPGIVEAENRITFQNIHQYPYIHANWSRDFNEWYDTFYHHRNYHLEIEQVSHITQIVLSGYGIAFFPCCVIKKYLQSGQLVNIPYDDGGVTPYYEGSLIYMKRNRDKLIDLVNAITSRQELGNAH